MLNQEEKQRLSLQPEQIKPQIHFLSLQNLHEKNSEQTQTIYLEEEKCKLKIQMIMCKLPQHQADKDSQKCNQRQGEKNLQQQQDNNEDIPNMQQKAIKITAIQDEYHYTGMLTEQMINENQKVFSIEFLYTHLVEEFRKTYLNAQDRQIIMNKHDQIIELHFKISKTQNLIKYFKSFTWNLLQQKPEKIVFKRMKDYQKSIQSQLSCMSQELKEQSKREFTTFKSEIIERLNAFEHKIYNSLQIQNQPENMNGLNQQSFNGISNIHSSNSSSNINKFLDKSTQFNLYRQKYLEQEQQIDLQQTTGFFWFWPTLIKEGVFTVNFRIQQINKNGLKIGFDYSYKPQNNLTYEVYLHNDYLIKQQDQYALQSPLQVNDNIIVTIDMNQLMVVLQQNQKIIIKSKLEHNGQREFWFLVGFLEEVEDIKQFIEMN